MRPRILDCSLPIRRRRTIILKTYAGLNGLLRRLFPRTDSSFGVAKGQLEVSEIFRYDRFFLSSIIQSEVADGFENFLGSE